VAYIFKEGETSSFASCYVDTNGYYIFDISSPRSLKMVGYFPNTDPGSYLHVPADPARTVRVPARFFDIAIAGNYVYIAALRGHSVILCEKETKLGGQLNLADVAPYKDRVGILNQYLQTQLSKLGVELRLGEEVTLSSVELIKPDAVVVATGVADFTPDIPGLHTSRAVHAGDVLAGKAQVGPKVVVIGGEVVGCETAEFLADRGRKVVVTRRGTEMAMGIGPVLREFLLDRLKAKGVTLLTGVTYMEVSSSEVTITTREGQTRVIEADTIVLAAGAEPNRTLYDQLKGRVAETYLVGDCIEPRSIRDAIADGFRIGHII